MKVYQNTHLLIDEQMQATYQIRKWKSRIMCYLLGLATLVSLIPLSSVLILVCQKGYPSLNVYFFTELPKEAGDLHSGMANAIVGTFLLVFLGCTGGLTFGFTAGLYLSEYTHEPLNRIVRFTIEILSSTPSIIIGLFVYACVVLPMHRFSAVAGGSALVLLMIPIVARSVEEILKMVPLHLREAGLALGLPRWRVTVSIVLKSSLKAIVTGMMLAIARISGETAPLLFTAFNNRFWAQGLLDPIASLPVQIYTYAISPYEQWHEQAWSGALVLIFFVFVLNLTTRVVLNRPGRQKF